MNRALELKFLPSAQLESGSNAAFPLQSHSNPNQYLAVETAPGEGDIRFSTYTRLATISAFATAISSSTEERSVLREAVLNLWNLYRYNQHYIGFLNGGLSTDDFNSIAELYAKEPRDYSTEQLRNAAQILLPLIRDDEFTSRDFAAVLNAHSDQLELVFSSEGR